MVCSILERYAYSPGWANKPVILTHEISATFTP